MKSMTRTLAVAKRVLAQIRNDKRTLALMFLVPSLLTGLFSWMLNSQAGFNAVGPKLVGLFPFTVMFLAASMTTLRERRSGTLERFLTTPMRRYEFLIGYALAFGLLAILQSAVTLGFSVWVCGLSVDDSVGMLYVAACANALCGMALGLLASAFAQSEFQVIQFLPAFIFPQIILGGLLVPTSQMPSILRTIGDWLPLTHALRSISEISSGSPASDVTTEILIVAAVSVGSLLLGALTLRKRTE